MYDWSIHAFLQTKIIDLKLHMIAWESVLSLVNNHEHNSPVTPFLLLNVTPSSPPGVGEDSPLLCLLSMLAHSSL